MSKLTTQKPPLSGNKMKSSESKKIEQITKGFDDMDLSKKNRRKHKTPNTEGVDNVALIQLSPSSRRNVVSSASKCQKRLFSNRKKHVPAEKVTKKIATKVGKLIQKAEEVTSGTKIRTARDSKTKRLKIFAQSGFLTGIDEKFKDTMLMGVETMDALVDKLPDRGTIEGFLEVFQNLEDKLPDDVSSQFKKGIDAFANLSEKASSVKSELSSMKGDIVEVLKELIIVFGGIALGFVAYKSDPGYKKNIAAVLSVLILTGEFGIPKKILAFFKKFISLLHKPAPQSGMPELISMASTILMTYIGVKCDKVKLEKQHIDAFTNSQMLLSFYKNISQHSVSTSKLEPFISQCVVFAQDVVNFFLDKVLGREKIKFDLTKEDDINRWVDRVTDFCKLAYQGELHLTVDNADRAWCMKMEGQQFLSQKFASTNEAARIRQVISTALQTLNKVVAKFESVGISGGGPRMEPLCVMLCGATGIGKSFATFPFISKIMARTLPKEELPRFLENYNDYSYTRQAEHKYWDGYRGQFCCIMDDFGQAKDIAGQPENEFFDIIRAVNMFPFICHMASLESKGNTVFRSKMIFATSNLVRINPQSMISPEAVCRRLMRIVISPKLEYCSNDVADPLLRKLDLNKVPKGDPDFSIYEFRLVDKDPYSVNYVGDVMDYDQIVDYCVDAYYEKQRSAEHFLKFLKQDVRNEVDKRLASETIKAQSGCCDDTPGGFPEEIERQTIDLDTNTQYPKADIKLREKYEELGESYREMLKELQNELEPSTRAVENVQTLKILQSMGYSNSDVKRFCHIVEKTYKEEVCAIAVPHGIDLLTYYRTVYALEWDDLVSRKMIEMSVKFESQRIWRVLSKSWADRKIMNRFRREVLTVNWNPDEEDITFMEKAKSFLKEIWEGYFWCSENIQWMYPRLSRFFQAMVTISLVTKVITYIASLVRDWTVGETRNYIVVVHEKTKQVATVRGKITADMLKQFKSMGWYPYKEGKVQQFWIGKDLYDIAISNQKEEDPPEAELPGYEVHMEDSDQEIMDGDPSPEIYDKDTKTRHSRARRLRSKKHVKPHKEDVEAQGCGDTSCDQIADALTRKSLYTLYGLSENDEEKLFGTVMFIKEHTAVLPYHFITDIESDLENGRKFRKFILESLDADRNIEVTMEQLLSCQVPSGFKNKDLCVLVLTNKTCLSHKDITSYFIRERSLAALCKFDVLLPLTVNGTVYKHFGVANLQEDFTVHGSSKTWTVKDGFRYKVTTLQGDCGTPVLIMKEAIAPGKIMGFHVAGLPSESIGYAPVITYEDIIAVTSPVESQNGMWVSKVTYDQCMRLTKKEDYSLDFSGGFDYIGHAPFGVSRPSTTAIRRSQLYGKWKPPSTAPAVLRPKMIGGKVIDPAIIGLEKYGSPEIDLSGELLTVCCKAISANLMRHKGTSHNRIYTFEEAVMGDDMDSNFRSIPRTTSAGFPFVIMKPQNARGKTHWLGNDMEYDMTSAEMLGLRELVDTQILSLRNGVLPKYIFTDNLKDERRKLEKVKMLKTRLFSASPMDLLIVMRMYFGSFVVMMIENRLVNGSAVGINAYSSEWNTLAHLLKSRGVHNVAGDWAGFDTKQMASMIRAILEHVIQPFYDDGDENFRIRQLLVESIVNSLHIFGDVVYQWKKNMPSGCFLTTILNTLYGMVLMAMCYCSLAGGPEHIISYFDDVYYVGYGDDNVMNISDRAIGWFNQNTIPGAMVQFGMNYGVETKTSGAVENSRSLEEVSFLKRRWRFDSFLTQRYIAPLELDVVLEMPFWTKKGPLREQIEEDNVQHSLEELSLHEKEIFDEWAPRILEESWKVGIYPILTTYKVLLQSTVNREDCY